MMAAWREKRVKRDVRPQRCVYCGSRCDGLTCRAHDDLPELDTRAVGISVDAVDKRRA